MIQFKFLKNEIKENQLRSLYGGANQTNNAQTDGDFVDNCGYTSYGDCSPQTEDGLPTTNDCEQEK